MRARPVVLLLALLAALALAAPATAPAADADVQTAWTSEDSALKTATSALSRSLRTAQRAKFRRVRGTVTAIRKLESLTTAVRDRVIATSPSTQSGARARDSVLASLKGFASSLRNLRLAVQAASKKKLGTARRLLARSKRDADGASDDATDARIWFEAAVREAEFQRQQQEQPPPPPPPPPEGGGESQPPPSDGGGSQPPPSGGGGSGGGTQPPPPAPNECDPAVTPTVPPPAACFLP